MNQYQVPATHAVLRIEQTTFHVHSDNAMIDSGSGFYIHCWDRENQKPETISVHTGRDDIERTPPDVNATPEEYALELAHRAAAGFISAVRYVGTKSHHIEQGRQIRVVRGRKVALGTYEVVAHRMGNYGPYVNLRDATGKYYNYISVGNIEVIPNPTVFRDAPQFKINPTGAAFLEKLAESGYDKTGWLALADFIAEYGHVWHGGSDFDMESVDQVMFANALIRLVNDSTTRLNPDKYQIERQHDLR